MHSISVCVSVGGCLCLCVSTCVPYVFVLWGGGVCVCSICVVVCACVCVVYSVLWCHLCVTVSESAVAVASMCDFSPRNYDPPRQLHVCQTSLYL